MLRTLVGTVSWEENEPGPFCVCTRRPELREKGGMAAGVLVPWSMKTGDQRVPAWPKSRPEVGTRDSPGRRAAGARGTIPFSGSSGTFSRRRALAASGGQDAGTEPPDSGARELSGVRLVLQERGQDQDAQQSALGGEGPSDEAMCRWAQTKKSVAKRLIRCAVWGG